MGMRSSVVLLAVLMMIAVVTFGEQGSHAIDSQTATAKKATLEEVLLAISDASFGIQAYATATKSYIGRFSGLNHPISMTVATKPITLIFVVDFSTSVPVLVRNDPRTPSHVTTKNKIAIVGEGH